MKELIGKVVYQCEHCGKLSLGKGAMIVHERCCKKNPSNHTPCASCKYLKKITTEIPNTRKHRCYRCPNYYVDSWDNGYSSCRLTDGECDGSLFKTEFVCEKTKKKMYYPRKVFLMSKEKRNEIISRCDCAMPNECELYKWDNNY